MSSFSQMISGWSVLVLGCVLLCVGCETLPEPGNISVPERPVDPLPFEKEGYTVVQKENPIAKIAPARKVIAVTPGKKLSAAEISEILQQAEDKAASATALSRGAQSKEDWQLAIAQWSKAIDLIKPIASVKSTYQQLLGNYQRELAIAQDKAVSNPRQLVNTPAPSGSFGTPLLTTSEEKKAEPNAAPAASPAPGSAPAPAPESKPESKPESAPSN